MRQFERMSEEYSNKNYPQGSVIATVEKHSKSEKLTYYLFILPFSILFLIIAFFAVYYSISEDKDIASALAALAFFGGIGGFGVWSIVPKIKRRNLGLDGWIAKIAERNKYSESDIREFDRQALASDSLILELIGKVKSFFATQSKGILSRDFICMDSGIHLKVMKHIDIQYACLVQRTKQMFMFDHRSKTITYLTVTLVSKQDTMIEAETDMERGTMLIDLLLEKNPNIDTNNKQVLTEKEFKKYMKS